MATHASVAEKPVAKPATKRAARVAPAKKPEPIRTTSESLAVKSRRARLDAALTAAGGVGTDAGQQILEAAGAASARSPFALPDPEQVTDALAPAEEISIA
jgi:hypothetical protein